MAKWRIPRVDENCRLPTTVGGEKTIQNRDRERTVPKGKQFDTTKETRYSDPRSEGERGEEPLGANRCDKFKINLIN